MTTNDIEKAEIFLCCNNEDKHFTFFSIVNNKHLK